MAFGSASLAFDILAKDRASNTFDKVGNSATRSSGKMKVFGRALAGAFSGAAIFAGGRAAVGFLVDAGKAAADDEKAQRLLALQLRNSAGATKEQIAQTEAWIAKAGLAFGVVDDDLRPALAKLAVATGDVGKAQDLARLAMDVSAGRGKTLAQVTEALAKAQTGSLGGLARLGIATKDAAGETKSLDQITRELAKTYDGAAAKSANTTAGKFARLKVQFDETKEAIGARLLPVALKLGTWLLDKGVPAATALGTSLSVTLGPAVTEVWSALKDLKPAAESTLEWMSGMQDHGTAASRVVLGLAAAFVAVKVSLAAYNVVMAISTGITATQTAATALSNSTFGTRVGVMALDFAGWVRNTAATAASTVATGVNTAATAVSNANIGTRIGLMAGATASWLAATAATVGNTVATVASTIAVGASAAATGVWTAAQWLLNAALTANPIGIVVVAIGALVAGLVIAYQKSDTFRSIVDATWTVVSKGKFLLLGLLGPVGLLAGALITAYQNSDKFRAAVNLLARKGKEGFEALGEAGTWLWNNALQPAFHFIISGVSSILGLWASMLGTLGKVPGFGWAKDAATAMGNAADKAQDLADGIRKIPPNKDVTVTTTYAYHGVRPDQQTPNGPAYENNPRLAFGGRSRGAAAPGGYTVDEMAAALAKALDGSTLVLQGGENAGQMAYLRTGGF